MKLGKLVSVIYFLFFLSDYACFLCNRSEEACNFTDRDLKKNARIIRLHSFHNLESKGGRFVDSNSNNHVYDDELALFLCDSL